MHKQSKAFRRLLVLAGCVAVAALFVVLPVSTAAQPTSSNANQTRPHGFRCNPAGTVCQFSSFEAYGPLDTGLVCGSGPRAFDIFDQGVHTDSGTVWFDANGDVTKFTVHIVYSFGQWSNPVSGDVVSYTQHNEETDVFAVPGDFTSITQTMTGENIYRPATGQPVLLNAGIQVFNFDQSVLLSSHGPNAFVAAFFEGDAHAFDQVCAALGA